MGRGGHCITGKIQGSSPRYRVMCAWLLRPPLRRDAPPPCGLLAVLSTLVPDIEHVHCRPTRSVHLITLATSYPFFRRASGNTAHQDMTASNTVFAVFSAIGLVLSLIPLWWHLELCNVGTCMFMIWTALACLVYFVDSIVWSGNTVNRAPVWCDICAFRKPFVQFSYLTSFI